MNANFTVASTLLTGWLDDVERGEPPVRYALASPFEGIDLRPGRLILLGGCPGSGKTSAVLQVIVDLLRLNPTARVAMLNAETAPSLLLERIAARAARVPLTALADRTLTDAQKGNVRIAVMQLESVLARLAFVGPPYTLRHVAAVATEFQAGIVVLDYLQVIVSGNDDAKTAREELESMTGLIRSFCDLGACVVAVAAVSRQRGNTGSTYAGLGLASFRGSSAMEYSADAAYLAVPEPTAGTVLFQNVKNRFGPLIDIPTRFDPSLQLFTAAPAGLDGFDEVRPAPERRRPKGGRGWRVIRDT